MVVDRNILTGDGRCRLDCDESSARTRSPDGFHVRLETEAMRALFLNWME
jgi:hypothetical protein